MYRTVVHVPCVVSPFGITAMTSLEKTWRTGERPVPLWQAEWTRPATNFRLKRLSSLADCLLYTDLYTASAADQAHHRLGHLYQLRRRSSAGFSTPLAHAGVFRCFGKSQWSKPDRTTAAKIHCRMYESYCIGGIEDAGLKPLCPTLYSPLRQQTNADITQRTAQNMYT